jgi:hypothetical protein
VVLYDHSVLRKQGRSEIIRMPTTVLRKEGGHWKVVAARMADAPNVPENE